VREKKKAEERGYIHTAFSLSAATQWFTLTWTGKDLPSHGSAGGIFCFFSYMRCFADFDLAKQQHRRT
jgi:hypothetical protein